MLETQGMLILWGIEFDYVGVVPINFGFIQLDPSTVWLREEAPGH